MKIDVLDHGYVELVECWGHGKDGFDVGGDEEIVTDYETGIVEAARQSTQGSFRGWEQDEKLLKYLLDHKHHTPFEFAGMVLEVQAPIFVFREWHRHRTQSYNEMSARYAPLPDLYYVPTVERVMANNKFNANKQAGAVAGADDLTEVMAKEYIAILQGDYADAEDSYKSALHAGVPKELARLIMPVGHYSRMRASTSLRCWLQFLTLRLDPAAQWEIRQYAEAVKTLVAQRFPVTHRNYFT
jgi:thymidylate synthase (FAD)